MVIMKPGNRKSLVAHCPAIHASRDWFLPESSTADGHYKKACEYEAYSKQ
jgi:hypothetical protein